jgi:hypothetical protein
MALAPIPMVEPNTAGRARSLAAERLERAS